MVTRSGHSLVELLVTVAFLAAATGAVAAGAILAYRGTADAVRRQEALSAAAFVLDSLLLAPDPRPGERVIGAFRVRWLVEPDSAGRLVSVSAVGNGTSDGRSRAVAGVEALWTLPPPRLGHRPEGDGAVESGGGRP